MQVRLLCFLCFNSLVTIGSGCRPLWPQIPSDESGTLVMVAKTASQVILSVDSKVCVQFPLSPDVIPVTPIDGNRKLVNVGRYSACALDGNLGTNKNDLDVSASLRLWVAANPTTEAQEAINALLDAAAGAWDRHHYTLAEISVLRRKLGSLITKITCGEFVDGHPIIVIGETYVETDGLFGQVAAKRVLSSREDEIFDVSGVFPTAHYFTTLIRAPISLHGIDGLETNDGDRAVREDIQGNAAAMAALFTWSSPPSVWTEADVKNLFVPTVASVEKHFSKETGTPNNVRILTTCGRLETTLEADWPTCPPPKTPLTKKSKKSSAKVKKWWHL